MTIELLYNQLMHLDICVDDVKKQQAATHAELAVLKATIGNAKWVVVAFVSILGPLITEGLHVLFHH